MIPQGISPPEGGWEPQKLYLVMVSHTAFQEPYEAIFYSGFVINDVPARYNQLWHPANSRIYKYEELYFMEVVRPLEVTL